MNIQIPDPGQIVNVRERPYVVLDVYETNVVPNTGTSIINKPKHRLLLSSLEDDSIGEEIEVFWEIEPGASISETVSLPKPEGFDDPSLLDAFLDAVNWGAASTSDKSSLHSPFRSGIEIEDYQLDPLVRAIRMPRVNLLIADDVGLGKTIETGLVIQELIIRHRLRTALVLCPASLQVQWRDQMRDKFGLEFRIVDRNLMKELRRKRGIHVNPWNHFPRLISSIDFFKQERVLRQFVDTLPSKEESQYPRRYDMLVVDEAHNIAPSGGGKYAVDSLRTSAIRQIVPHFEHKLFLTATPHNGYVESFSALLELLDSQRFARAVLPQKKQLNSIMIRRLKSELPPYWDGTPRFPERKLKTIEVEYNQLETDIHQILSDYTKSRLKKSESNEEKFASEFVLKLLKKRLFSSVAAFQSTLAKHIESLESSVKKKQKKYIKPTLNQLHKMIIKVEEDYANDDEYEENEADVIETTTRLFREPDQTEQDYLKQMKEWADDAVNRPDCKTNQLIEWLHTTIKPNGHWSDERVIIFTEFRDTQKWLQHILSNEKLMEDERLLTLYGGLHIDDREKVKSAFQTHPSKSDVRILLATDSASEGIDLQNHCNKLIHFEIPWNPNRMEQRNGRIDRHGQKANEVLVYHFVGKGYEDHKNMREQKVSELYADLEFLMRAAKKVNQIRTDLGKVGPVIAQQVETAMMGKSNILDTEAAEKDAKSKGAILRLERNLEEQIKRITEQKEETKHTLRLTPENIKHVVNTGLQLANQPQLIEAELDGVWPDHKNKRSESPVFRLPHLTGSWRDCSEGLMHPHSQEVRPITFDQSIIKGRDDVVLCHLNHKLVQMCLRLLRAELWAMNSKKLNRVSAQFVPSHILNNPAMIAYARLVILGTDNQRLVEEIITAGGTLNQGRFQRMNVTEIKTALAERLPDEPSDDMKERLATVYYDNSDSLEKALQARMKDRTESLQKQLQDQAAKDIETIESSMNDLLNSIKTELNEIAKGDDQMTLFDLSEREQRDSDIRNLRLRLRQIPGEIKTETAQIKKRYENPTPRMFPVALTFLVPEKMS